MTLEDICGRGCDFMVLLGAKLLKNLKFSNKLEILTLIKEVIFF